MNNLKKQLEKFGYKDITEQVIKLTSKSNKNILVVGNGEESIWIDFENKNVTFAGGNENNELEIHFEVINLINKIINLN